MGLPQYSRPGKGAINGPAPLPEEAPDVEEALDHLRTWAGLACPSPG